MKDTFRKAVSLKKKKRYSKGDITPEVTFLKDSTVLTNFIKLHSRIQQNEIHMRNGIEKRLRFLIDFGKFEKQNLQLTEFDNRLKQVEEKMQNIQTESKDRFLYFIFHMHLLSRIFFVENGFKTIHSPSFKASIDRKLDKTEIYAREEIVQSFFG